MFQRIVILYRNKKEKQPHLHRFYPCYFLTTELCTTKSGSITKYLSLQTFGLYVHTVLTIHFFLRNTCTPQRSINSNCTSDIELCYGESRTSIFYSEGFQLSEVYRVSDLAVLSRVLVESHEAHRLRSEVRYRVLLERRVDLKSTVMLTLDI